MRDTVHEPLTNKREGDTAARVVRMKRVVRDSRKNTGDSFGTVRALRRV